MIYVKNSGNGKLGPNVDATYASIDDTCPRSCALRDAGCYAQQWRVNETQKRAKTGRGPRAAARAEARAIRASKSSNPVRLHVAGDARTNEAARILARACEGRRAWSYTHAWRVVRRESWGAVSTLASLENPRDVAHAASLGYAVAIVVAELPSDGKAFAPPELPKDGRRSRVRQ